LQSEKFIFHSLPPFPHALTTRFNGREHYLFFPLFTAAT